MNKCLNIIKIISGFGGILLAISIFMLVLQIQYLRVEIPTLIEKIDATVLRVTPIITEISQLQAVLPSIIEQSQGYQVLLPQVLTRIDDINQHIPAIIQEVEKVRSEIPPILEQTEAWRKVVPDMLTRVDNTNATISNVNQQIPSILDESVALRHDVPTMLTQAQTLVNQAETAGKQASKGVVSGVLGGIFSSPLQLIDTIGVISSDTLGLKDETSITEVDQQHYKDALSKLMLSPKEGHYQQWKNNTSGNYGVITINSIDINDGVSCYIIDSDFTIVTGKDKGKHNLSTKKCIK